MLLVSVMVCSQNPYIQRYTTSNGLPSNMVYRVFQDSRKFIWMATDAGVARYDGTNFKYFTTKDGMNTSEIIHIQEDSKGRIWMFNFNGTFNYYDKGKIYNGKNAPFLDSLQSPFVFRKMYEDQDKTLYFYDNFFRDVYLLDYENKVKKLKTSEWFSGGYDKDLKPIYQNSIRFLKSNDGFFYYFAAGGLYRVQNIPDLPTPLDESTAIDRVFVNENEITFVDGIEKKSKNNLLLKYKSFQISDTIKTPFRHKNELINDVLEDDSYNYWVSTNSGLFCIKNERVIFKIDGNIFQNIIQDNEGNIWACSLEDGIYKISSFLLKHTHKKLDFYGNTKILATCKRSKGGIWAIDGKRLYLVKDNSVYKSELITESGYISQIKELQNDDLILGQPNSSLKAITGISLTNKSIRFNVLEIGNQIVKKFSVNSRKDKVVAFYPTKVLEFTQEHLLNDKKVFDFPEERLYGIYHNAEDQLFVNGKRIYKFKEGKLLPFKPLEKLKGKIIRQHINLEKQLELFNIGGENLYLFNGQDLFSLSNTFNPRTRQQIKYVTYKSPYLFFATNSQVYFCALPATFSNSTRIDLKNLDLSFNNIHHLLIDKNDLIVSSDDGMSFIPLMHLVTIKPKPPIPYFRNIIVNDKPIPFANVPTIIRGKNKFQFILGNIRYNSSKTHYAYKLEGRDNTWNTGTAHNINYQNLRPGNYTFRFKVKLPSSNWSMEKVHYIQVRPTLLQHPLFFVFGTVVVMVLFFFYFNNLQKALIKRHETEHQIVLLEQKALHLMMNPHFIFNALASIQSYILKNKAYDAGTYLSQFARLIRQNLNATKTSVIDLEEEIERLRNYLELEQLRMNNRFSFNISVDKSIDDEILIPSMILQPIIENAIWHGLADVESDGLIDIRFTLLDEDIIKIIIEDNGIGMEQAAKQKIHKKAHLKIGMELTRKRLIVLGKKMNVKTSMNATEAFPGNPRPGTRVEIIAPVSYEKPAIG